MLNFQPLKLIDLPYLRQYFTVNPGRLCDSTPGSALIWRELYHTEWALEGDTLYFKVTAPELGETFPLPQGPDRESQYCALAEYCCQNAIPISFFPVPREELEGLQAHFPNTTAISQRDNADYLYRAEDLAFFRGKKFSGQRNHVNKFKKNYDDLWEFHPMTRADIPALLEFLDRYAAGWPKASPSFLEDIAKTREVLEYFEIYGLLGGVLTVDGRVVGFSLGEILGDTLFTHIEKADRDYDGSYQMLVSQFAQYYAQGQVAFINREDDTGDPGLRKSKLSYQPVALLEKFAVTVDTPCDYAGTCPL